MTRQCPGCWRVAMGSDPVGQRYVHEIHPCYPNCHTSPDWIAKSFTPQDISARIRHRKPVVVLHP